MVDTLPCPECDNQFPVEEVLASIAELTGGIVGVGVTESGENVGPEVPVWCDSCGTPLIFGMKLDEDGERVGIGVRRDDDIEGVSHDG